MMERFATKTKNCSLFFVKYSILDVSQSAEYASECTERTKSRIINTLTTNVSYHIETSQLICIANQFTGFYMMGNIGR